MPPCLQHSPPAREWGTAWMNGLGQPHKARRTESCPPPLCLHQDTLHPTEASVSSACEGSVSF